MQCEPFQRAERPCLPPKMAPSPAPSVALYGRATFHGTCSSRLATPTRVDFELAQSGDGAFSYSLRWRPILGNGNSNGNNASTTIKSGLFSSSKKLSITACTDGELPMDRIFGATCGSALPRVGAGHHASSLKSLADSTTSSHSNSSSCKFLFIHTLECSSDPAVRYKKGYTYNYYAFETEEGAEAGDWARVISSLARGEPLSSPPPSSPSSKKPRILVIINPFAGTKSAPRIYADKVKPMLSLAGFVPTVVSTERMGHATEIIKTMAASDLYPVEGVGGGDGGGGGVEEPYSRIITVSGDGVFHEVIQGLFERADWAKAIPYVKLGVVSGGSANALSRNTGEGASVEGTIRGIIAGTTQPLSLMALTQHPENASEAKTLYSHLELLWTFAADADIESERQRWAGYGGFLDRGEIDVVKSSDSDQCSGLPTARVTVQAVIRMLRLREYSGTLYWLEEDRAQSSAATATPTPPQPDPISAPQPISFKPLPANKPVLKYANVLPSQLTTANGWKRTAPDYKFTFFCAMRLPWAAPDTLFAPDARLGDNYLSLVHSNTTDRGKFISAMTSGESPTQGIGGNHDWVSHARCRAFVLFPGTRKGKNGTEKHGVLDVDGEVIPQGGCWGEVIEDKVRLLVPPWFEEGEWGGVRAPWKERK